MKTGWFIVLAGAFYLFVVALFWPVEKKVLPSGITAMKGYERGTVVFSDTSVDVTIPSTIAAQELGLGGRASLGATTGMLWLFTDPQLPSFWMKGMHFPLDFIWIRSNHIVDITTDVPPPATLTEPLPTYQPSAQVDAVLEVNAGFAAAHGLAIGEVLRLDRR